jgi:hypothetical protein
MTVLYQEVGNAITITYDAEDAWANILPVIWAQSTLIDTTGSSSDTPVVNEYNQLSGGQNGTITSTTAQVASKLNESTQVSASGGTGATATAESSFNLQGGADAPGVTRHVYQRGRPTVWAPSYFR